MLDFIEEFKKKYPKGAIVNYDAARDYGYGLTWKMGTDTVEKFRKDDGEYITFPNIQPYSTLTTDYHIFIIRYGVMYELEKGSREDTYKIKRIVDEFKPRTFDKIFKNPSIVHKDSANRFSEPIYIIEEEQ